MDPDLFAAEYREWGRRADQLGIPWLASQELDEIKALVVAKERAMEIGDAKLVHGQWQFSGQLPNGIIFVDGIFRTETLVQPDCFGELWDATPVAGPPLCTTECLFATWCREKTAKIILPAAQAKLGAAATLQALSEELAISEQSVLVLMAQASGEPIEIKRKKKPSEVDPVVPSVEKTGKTKKTKVADVVIPDPQIALSVKSATDGALASTEKEEFAKHAKAQDDGSPGTWGKHTWPDRYRREHRRSRLIGKLVPGMVLHVTRNGQTHTCRVNRLSYTYQDCEYPTLYAVTLVAAGVVARPGQARKGRPATQEFRPICNWSAAKFWALHKVLSKA